MGIEWFSGNLPGIFLLPVLPVYPVWCKNPVVGCVFRLRPDILSPFSQKTDNFLLLTWLYHYFKERFAVRGLSRFPGYILHQSGKTQPAFFTGRAVRLPEIPDAFQYFIPHRILFFPNPAAIFQSLCFFGFAFLCQELFCRFDVLFPVTAGKNPVIA